MILRTAIAQINTTVGAITANAQAIIHAAEQAVANGVHIVITPELALSGYIPQDRLADKSFLQTIQQALKDIASATAAEDIWCIVGHPSADNGFVYNSASVLHGGEVLHTYHKQALPNYGVFDEKRYFSAGSGFMHFTCQEQQVGIVICEDLWDAELMRRLQESPPIDLLISLNASPFTLAKAEQRQQMCQNHLAPLQLPLIYVNAIGTQDSLVFDGGSFVQDAQGDCFTTFPEFSETLAYVDWQRQDQQPLVPIDTHTIWVAEPPMPALDDAAQHPLKRLYQALGFALKDYMRKNRMSSVWIALSGGMDSALVLALAVDVLGADKVHTVMMPSTYTADISQTDAQQMAQHLGVSYQVIPIGSMTSAFEQALAPSFLGKAIDTTEENIQARVRGTIIMALSNKHGGIVITTGNKSEMAMGYCTLYGDMAGSYALLKDVYKTDVYALARWRNEQGEVIPERIITRPPSAELRPDQTDQDSLPPYEELDRILYGYMEQRMSKAELLAQESPAVVERIIRALHQTEYKRQQAAIGPKVSERAFGTDWRFPQTDHFTLEG